MANETTYHISCDITKVAGVAFVDPGVTPPVAGYQVTEPLVSKLVRHQSCCVMLV